MSAAAENVATTVGGLVGKVVDRCWAIPVAKLEVVSVVDEAEVADEDEDDAISRNLQQVGLG